MTRRWPAALVLAVATLLLAAPRPAGAQGPPDESMRHPARREFLGYEPATYPSLLRWFDQEYMLGDLGGARAALARLGITPTLTFVADAQGNPVGGERHGFREFQNVGLDVTVDLAKAGGPTGGQFHLSASWRSGTSLSDIDIGNVFNVAQVCCGATFRLVNVSYQQSLLDDRLNVLAGRIAAGDEFLTSPLYSPFVQSGLDGNPAGIFSTTKGFNAYPTATWGVRVRGKPAEDVYVMAAVLNGDPTLGENDKHGVDWSLDGRAFTIVEAGWRVNQHPGAMGLPGNYKLGVWYDDSDFDDFSSQAPGAPSRTTRGNAGFYVLADQMVYRPGGPGTRRGLTPFLSILVAPSNDISTFPLFVNGGLVYRGLLPSRPGDTATFGVVYGRFSDKLRAAQRAAGEGVQSYEIALEWSYIIALAPWLNVQPDIQYIIRPGGTGRIANALVLGFQVAVNF